MLPGAPVPWLGDLVLVFLAGGVVWWLSSWLLVAEFLGVGLAGLVGGSQQGCPSVEAPSPGPVLQGQFCA